MPAWADRRRGRGRKAPSTAAAASSRKKTGYQAAQWEDLGEFWSSPGMITESFTLLKATGLTRVGDGGGTDHEDIVVHRVPIARMAESSPSTARAATRSIPSC
jgi:ADP-ribose pyrophosphatase